MHLIRLETSVCAFHQCGIPFDQIQNIHASFCLQLNGFFQPVTSGFYEFQFMKSGTFFFVNIIFGYILNLVDQILFYPFGTSLQQDIFFSVLNVYRPRSSVETDPSPVP